MSRQRMDDPGLQSEKEIALGFDLQRLEPGFLEDPFPTYHSLRRWDPVHRCPDGSYFLTRYDDEEFLRYESSNQLGNRRALADVEIGGVAMPAGTLITLGIGAANRDPAQFPDPDRLDIARAPNRHLAFATGIHACAGIWLARMEGQVAIGRLVRRFPNIRPAGPVVRGGRARFRGLAQFPVSV